MDVYKSKYSWRPGYNYKVSADVVGSVLEKIEERDGEVTSRAFLDYSRPEDAETHSMFEWNDGIAAEKWRMFQSGRIINQLDVEMVIVETSHETTELELESPHESRTQSISAFMNVIPKKPGSPGTYRNVYSAMEDEKLRRQVLLNANNELQAFARKYQQYQEFAGVIAEIRKVMI